MSPHAWTEDQLVEQPAIGLFADMGWQALSALDERWRAWRLAGLQAVCDAGGKPHRQNRK